MFDATPNQIEPQTKINIARVRDRIARAPDDMFDMNTTGKQDGHECKTPSCILGHIRAEVGYRMEREQAAEWLGLTDTQGANLFVLPMWSKDNCNVLPNRKGLDANKPQALRTLDHLIRTGEVDWSV